MNYQHTQAATLEAQFNRIFAANESAPRTITRIYSDGERIVGQTLRTDIPVRIKSEVKKWPGTSCTPAI